MRILYNLAVLAIDIVLLIVIVNAVIKEKDKTADAGYYETIAAAGSSSENEAVTDHTENDSGNSTYNTEVGTGSENVSTSESNDYRDFLLGGTASEGPGVEDQGLSEMETAGGSSASLLELTLEDFDWYESVVSNDWFPEEAEQFGDFNRMKGGWRAYIKFDPFNEAGRRTDILLHIYISGSEDDVAVECDWYWIHDYHDPEGSLDDDESSYYYGIWSDGEIHATGAGKMDILWFYEWDEEEYAIGRMESQAGVKAILCMMR